MFAGDCRLPQDDHLHETSKAEATFSVTGETNQFIPKVKKKKKQPKNAF